MIKCDICIVGSGIGGSALARFLMLHSPSCSVRVFEKDQSFSCRIQGYGLTMQQGGMALKSLKIDDAIRKVDTQNDVHYVFEPSGKLTSAFGGALYDHTRDDNTIRSAKATGEVQKKRYNLHLPRQKLRELLMEDVSIDWSHQYLSHKIDGDNVIAIMQTETGETIEVHCKALVGADGINSKVRNTITPPERNKLNYLGMLVVLGWAKNGDDTLYRRTTFQTFGGDDTTGTRLFTMPFTESELFWQLSFPCSVEEAESLRINKPLLIETIIKITKSWHHPITELLSNTDPANISATPVYDKGESYPFQDSDYTPSGPVTLLGDAAHPMSPFKGQGANQALLDACYLGEILHLKTIKRIEKAAKGVYVGKKKARKLGLDQKPKETILEEPDTRTVSERMRIFEKEMYHRSESKVIGSREMARKLHFTGIVDFEKKSGLNSSEFEGLGTWDGPKLIHKIRNIISQKGRMMYQKDFVLQTKHE